MILSAHQANFFPYPGVFEKIARSDVFVFLDNVQFVKREYHNRNRLRTPIGWKWLTIPVHVRFKSKMLDVFPTTKGWSLKHKNIVSYYYRKSKRLHLLDEIWKVIEPIEMESIPTINYYSTLKVLEILGITTKTVVQSHLALTPEEEADRDTRLISLCKRFNCDRYLSGVGGKEYIITEKWENDSIKVEYQNFCLKPYSQLFPGWETNMSILDLLLCVDDPISYICNQ